MWQPLFIKLKELYPNIEMKQHLHLGQDVLFNSAKSDREEDYDIVFEIGFPMNDHVSHMYTKAMYCCVQELGIDPVNALVKFKRVIASPLVGVHFFSTCLPDTYGCPENIAHKIWDAILDANLIPIDTHLKHTYNNPKNIRFDWNTCSIDCANADVLKLIGVLQRCAGFCGVASGNFNIATMLMPVDKLLFIENKSGLNHIYRMDALSVNVNKYDSGVVTEWISRLKDSNEYKK